MNTPLLLLLLLPVNHARSQPAQYDQRQEGKVNVQIHVKDVQVLALVDGDAIDDYIQNYDYAYDYADFTIKPGSRPTKPPTTSTTLKPTTPASTEKLNLTTSITNSPVKTFIVTGNDTVIDQDIKVIIKESEDEPVSSTVVPASSPEPRRRCPAGFEMKSGRCFKRPLISPRFTIKKLAPGLLKMLSLKRQTNS